MLFRGCCSSRRHNFIHILPAGSSCVNQVCYDKASDPKGNKYDGCFTTTVSGRTCQVTWTRLENDFLCFSCLQDWAVTSPHSHSYQIQSESNNCRNPDTTSGPWWDLSFSPTLKIWFQVFHNSIPGVTQPIQVLGGSFVQFPLAEVNILTFLFLRRPGMKYRKAKCVSEENSKWME